MAREEPHQGLMPSILDRLIDPDSGGTTGNRGYTIEQMEEAVHRDLEELLNTRQADVFIGDKYPEVHNSIVGYGLPDITSLNALTTQQRDEIGRALERAISFFEPRLKQVRVVMVDAVSGKERTVKFHIDAKMCVDPAPEVAFDTVLELTTGHYSVKPSEGV
jgi:type VI secretion system protein ImpF